jgi:DNA-binding XRE family transcriptional regulator
VTRKKLAKLLKDYRERRRFTQEDAAKHLGVSLRTLQNWEIARNMPRGVWTAGTRDGFGKGPEIDRAT